MPQKPALETPSPLWPVFTGPQAEPTPLAVLTLLKAVCHAAIAYDDAVRACANDPARMTEYRTAQGVDLDTLYLNWMVIARGALGQVTASEELRDGSGTNGITP
jgi:hypothetical protein